jgi:hypothetical protein
VHDAGLHDGLRLGLFHDTRQAFRPVADHEEHILDLQLRRSVSTLSQNLPPPVPGHTEDVFLPGHADPDRGVDRPVGNLPVP